LGISRQVFPGIRIIRPTKKSAGFLNNFFSPCEKNGLTVSNTLWNDGLFHGEFFTPLMS
jgi:hypothetical protein